MLFAEISVVEGGLITALIVGMGGTVGLLFKLVMAANEKALADMTSQRDSYKQMHNATIAALEDVAADKRVQEGKPMLPFVAPVVPERSSPETQAQKDTAELQTHRARQTAAFLSLGLPARQLWSPGDSEEGDDTKWQHKPDLDQR